MDALTSSFPSLAREASDRSFCGADIVEMDAVALSRLIRRRSLSCVELATAFLRQIERINPAHNALVSLRDADDILREAREKDERLARGSPAGALSGFPVAIKDLSAAKGLRTTLGSQIQRDCVARFDAPHVARMKRAGAIVVAKTNTAEFGLGSQTYNEVFGTTRNAYDTAWTAGGSSGGAAVAVAACMSPLADGSDNAGSIRNPAAFNNVYGLRPSQGRIPAEAGELALPSMSTIGPIARNVTDLALLLGVLDGREIEDLEAGSGGAEKAARGARVGWLGDLGGRLAFEPGVLEVCGKALETLEDLGCCVEPAAIDFDFEALWRDWLNLRSWTIGGSLASRYADPAKRPLMKPEAQWEVERALRLSAMDVFEAASGRSKWIRAVDAAFERYDYLVLPSSQCFPFEAALAWPKSIGGRVMDVYHRWMEVAVPATMAGCPALSVPVGLAVSGKPMGMQIIAARTRDLACLRLARAYEIGAEIETRAHRAARAAGPEIATWTR